MDHYDSLSSYGDPYYGVIELCLKDILYCIKPSENDRLKRLYAISELTTLVRSVESLKDVVIRPFGSFCSNLYTKWGDLDTSVELSHSSPSSTGRKRKQYVLRNIMRVLRRNGVARNVTIIPNARVPLLIFESNLHNVSCDVSIDNHMGWMKSRILLWISEIDERFRDMVLLTKEWAKAHHINDPKSGTLNSYSLCLLVIFLFQTCKPAILPPLKDIFEGNLCDITGTWSSLECLIEDICAANIARFKSFRQRNESTLCQLLFSFFDKFSKIERSSSEYAICTYTGQWERISSNPRWMEKSPILLIEDPFERPDNAARAVGPRELSWISEVFIRTSQNLSSYSVLSDRNALLASLVRSSISSQLKVGTKSHYTAQRNEEKTHFADSGYAVPCYADDAPFHKPNKTSQFKVGTGSHYTAQGNQEKPYCAVSGYAVSCYADDAGAPFPKTSNKSLQLKAGTTGHYTAQINQEKPQIPVSGFVSHVIHAPVPKSSNSSSQLKTGTQSHCTAQVGNQEKPQVSVSGYVSHVQVDKNSQSPPSLVPRQRQGYTNGRAQQVWRPRTSNR